MDRSNLRILFTSALFLGLALAALLFLAGGHLLRVRFRLPRVLRVRKRESIPGGTAISVSAFLLGFGGAGFLSSDRLFLALPIAAVTGGVLSALTIALFRRLVGGEGVAMAGGTIVGTPCRVSLAIPANGVGAVAYHAEGKRHTVPARAADDAALSPDTKVLITDLRKGVALVEEI